MDTIKNQKVSDVFKKYPEPMGKKLLYLRQLILETAAETEGIDQLEETLKWGEPSYLTKSGSTIRINCKTSLVETYRELYGDTFSFEDNRAIVFSGNDKIPVDELKHCISLALTYHNRKHPPMLGV